MAEETIHFEHMKVLVGGIRNDSAPTTYDEEPCVLRMNSDGALVVSTSGGSSSLAVSGPDAHDAAITGNPVLGGAEAADFDGAALPNAVDTDGDAVRVKASLSGVQYTMPVNEDGSATPLAPEGTAAGEGLQISLDDGTDSVFAQGDKDGNLKMVGPAAEDAAASGNPLLGGGRYDSSPRDLDDGDIGAIALDADGNQIVVGNISHDAADLGNPVKIGARARSSLFSTALTEDDRTDIVADLYGRLMTASFNIVDQADSQKRVNPEHSQVEGSVLVDVTNGVSTNGAGTVYDYYFSPREFGKFTLRLDFDGGTNGGADTGITANIYAAWQDDGTAKEDASMRYEDLSTTLLGGASYVVACGATGSLVVNDNGGICQNAKWVHLKLTVSANTGTADWAVDKGQRYI